MESLGKRIKARREELNIKQEKLATSVGIAQPTLANLESGKNQRTKFLAEFARELRTSVEWLTSQTDSHPGQIEAFPIQQDKFREVPVIGKGIGGLPDDRVWSDSDFPAGWSDQYAEIATSDKNAFLARVEESSMAPRYNPGEYFLVEPNTHPDPGDDVLVRFKNDGTSLKRLLSRRDSFVALGSYNTTAVITVREDEIVWIYYVAHPVPTRKIKQRI